VGRTRCKIGRKRHIGGWAAKKIKGEGEFHYILESKKKKFLQVSIC
jgi:hypothetical protein